MRLIRRFFVTITAAFIMFSAGHTASNAADRYYTAGKPGSGNITCVSEYKLCYAGYYLENGMCIKCPELFTSENLKDGGKTSCKISLDPGEYYSVEKESIDTCPEGYYCEGGEYFYDTNEQPLGLKECPAGSYCPEKSVKPTPCDAGYYCPQTGLKSQTICPKGYYCPDVKEDKKECEAGYYCPEKSVKPTPCDAGYYCPYTKQSDKTTAQLECGTGKYCEAGSAEPTKCPNVPKSASVNEWLPDVIDDKQICATDIDTDDITHKKEPEFVSYQTKAGAVTACQIKLEVEIPCGLVHIYHLQYDPDKKTYSNTEKLTSYYMSLNQGYYLHTQLYPPEKCNSPTHANYNSPLYYSKSSPCTGEDINYCFGLKRMPANCQEYNDYSAPFGIFTCGSGQYKLDTSDPNTIFPNFGDCPIGSYCKECQIYPCPSRYYCPTTGLTETTYQNYKCPTGATSDAGSEKITDCYLNNATIFQDKNGTFNLPMDKIHIIQQ